MKKIHGTIILTGIILILSGAFHTNLWFDEAYTVGIVNKSFLDIWKITGNDVHPALYYWMLKIVSLIFGENIIIYRLFSTLATIILSILGYTHIRKDFGEKTGALFSFFVLFLPSMAIYANEIRMYSWAMLFVTVTAIYAYRLLKANTMMNWIIFAVFSLASAYTHYYGLMTSGLINLLLFMYIIKHRKEKIRHLKYFIISAIIQIALYIPWLIYFVLQLNQVSSGFWIGISFPDTLIEILNTQFIGAFKGNRTAEFIIFAITIVFYTYICHLAYKTKKNKDSDNKAPLIALGIYLAVILAASAISLFMMSAILYYRYLVTTTGLLIFFFASFILKEKRKYMIIAVCSVIAIISIINNVKIVNENYDASNMTQVSYLEENIQKNDIFVYSNIGEGSVTAIHFPEYTQYFYNPDNWGVEEAYKAFGPNMSVETSLDFLKGYTGRIWIIDSDTSETYNDVFASMENIKLISIERIDTAYRDYKYTMTLVEKY